MGLESNKNYSEYTVKIKTMTLNLTEEEMVVLKELAVKKGLTKTQILRQALRLYQLVDHHAEKGMNIYFDDGFHKKEVIVCI